MILLADDLTPSDTAGIDPATVVGFATAGGGPTSHTAIIARALGIPALVGAGPGAARPAGGRHGGARRRRPAPCGSASARPT